MASHRSDANQLVTAVDVSWQRRDDDVEISLVRPVAERVDKIADHADEAQSVEQVVEPAVAQVQAILGRAELADAVIHLAADHPADHLDGAIEAIADATGFPQRRDLHQLRRPLPVEADHPRRQGPSVDTRAFRPDSADEEAWIRVNNRAFADHPDQGHETLASLAARMAEPWFDPAGFLVADDAARPGELSGFCWTKVHPATDVDPPLGEIYVIAVDPVRQGERLGPAFVLAGLDHLASIGLGHASLYVDEANTAARSLYAALGFHLHRRRRVYRP